MEDWPHSGRPSRNPRPNDRFNEECGRVRASAARSDRKHAAAVVRITRFSCRPTLSCLDLQRLLLI